MLSCIYGNSLKMCSLGKVASFNISKQLKLVSVSLMVSQNSSNHTHEQESKLNITHMALINTNLQLSNSRNKNCHFGPLNEVRPSVSLTNHMMKPKYMTHQESTYSYQVHAYALTPSVRLHLFLNLHYIARLLFIVVQ